MPEDSEEQLLSEQELLSYGTSQLIFHLSRRARKSLSIEVHPDTSVHVIAPNTASKEAVREKVLKRAAWIQKQQEYFEQFLPRSPKREYVAGESHYYLGRQYILRIKKATQLEEVKLKGGELQVFVGDISNHTQVKRLLMVWYYKNAKRVFRKTINESIKKFERYGIEKVPLIIKQMNKRWGSCTPKGRIVLNPEIIKAPSKCISYVVIHELCHLVHPNHSKDFYQLQSQMMPDWEKWKLKLEKMLN